MAWQHLIFKEIEDTYNANLSQFVVFGGKQILIENTKSTPQTESNDDSNVYKTYCSIVPN